MNPDEFVDRKRGILTKQQREHLMGRLDEDPDEDADKIRMRNRRIREHIRHSLLDFQLLASAYDNTTIIEDAIDPAGGEENPVDAPDRELQRGVSSTIEVLYRALGTLDPTGEFSAFDHVLYSGVSDALQRMYVKRGASVRPGYFRLDGDLGDIVPIGELKQRYDEGAFLHITELKQLYWAGEITYTEMETALDEQPDIDEMYESYGQEEAVERIEELHETRARQREEAAEEFAEAIEKERSEE